MSNIARILKGVKKASTMGPDPSGGYMKGSSRIIPSETRSGQLGMFASGSYHQAPRRRLLTEEQRENVIKGMVMRGIAEETRKGSAPFSGSRPVSGDARAKAKSAARRQELAAKRIAKKSTKPKMQSSVPPATTLEDDYVDWLFGVAGR